MKLNVCVIFGGESVEHDISIISANQAMSVMVNEEYNVIPLYMGKDRNFYFGYQLFDLTKFRNLDDLIKTLDRVSFVRKNGKLYLEFIKRTFFSRVINHIDIVFPIVHGTNGEDGILQGYLELMKIPYIGSDVMASAIGQDKALMKAALSNSNIKIVDWFWFYGELFEKEKDEILKKANDIGYPLIIKPASLGSSIGISSANDENEFIESVMEARTYDTKIVVEKKLVGFREINCSVLGDFKSCKTSELEEVLSDNVLLTFDDKYQNNSKAGMASAKRIFPVKLDKTIEDKIKSMAVDCFKLLGTSGVCRIDFMVDKNNEVYLNEINSIPGSLSYYLWSNLGFKGLINELVEIAFNRFDRKEKMVFSFDSNVLSGIGNLKNGKFTKGKMGG